MPESTHVAVSADGVAPPIGAYSQAIRAGNLLFVSGQVAFGADGQVVGVGDMEAQARAVFENLGRVVAAAGGGPGNITALTIFLTDMSRRAEVSKVRREFVVEPYPASSLVGVQALAHPDLLVEVEAIAVLPDQA
jgi:reactive intermediate/imine deaminase